MAARKRSRLVALIINRTQWVCPDVRLGPETVVHRHLSASDKVKRQAITQAVTPEPQLATNGLEEVPAGVIQQGIQRISR